MYIQNTYLQPKTKNLKKKKKTLSGKIRQFEFLCLPSNDLCIYISVYYINNHLVDGLFLCSIY